jgi:hypothetical protein
LDGGGVWEEQEQNSKVFPSETQSYSFFHALLHGEIRIGVFPPFDFSRAQKIARLLVGF